MSTFSAGARRPSWGTGSGSTRPFVRAGGPPWLQLRRPDAQHGLFGYSGMLAALTAIYAASRAVGLVRVAANDTTAIGRARGAGAAGVTVPLINMAEDAAAAQHPPFRPTARPAGWTAPRVSAARMTCAAFLAPTRPGTSDDA